MKQIVLALWRTNSQLFNLTIFLLSLSMTIVHCPPYETNSMCQVCSTWTIRRFFPQEKGTYTMILKYILKFH